MRSVAPRVSYRVTAMKVSSILKPTCKALQLRAFGSAPPSQQPRKPGVQSFTLKEVADHNYADDAWIIIHDKVYNITNWIPRHPGGNVILARAGKDGTDIFERLGHTDYAQDQLRSMYIGECSEPKRYDCIEDGMNWQLQTQLGVERYREKHPKPHDYRLNPDGTTNAEKETDHQ